MQESSGTDDQRQGVEESPKKGKRYNARKVKLKKKFSKKSFGCSKLILYFMSPSKNQNYKWGPIILIQKGGQYS